MIAPYREAVLPTLTVRRAPWWRRLLARVTGVRMELARRRKRLALIREAERWEAALGVGNVAVLQRQIAERLGRRRPYWARGTRPQSGVVVTYSVRDAIEAPRSERWLPPFCRRCGKPHPTRLSRRCA